MTDSKETEIVSVKSLSLDKNEPKHVIKEIESLTQSTKEFPRKWYQRLWLEPTHYATAEEKRFVRKLDFWILLWSNVAYILKSLDQSNVSNAYVSGMKEELHFKGNQYNMLDVCYRVGYSVGLIPSQIILLKVSPAKWLSFCELVWGILTALCAVSKTPEAMYPMRFFMGVFESSSWPGITNILFNFYTQKELISRLAYFQISSYTSGIFGGFLQSALHKLQGRHGLSGWQYMFIVNGAMTVLVAILGFFIIPDTPHNGGAKYWMNTRDREIAIERMDRVGKKTKRRVTFKQFLETIKDWKVWLFRILYQRLDHLIFLLQSMAEESDQLRWKQDI